MLSRMPRDIQIGDRFARMHYDDEKQSDEFDEDPPDQYGGLLCLWLGTPGCFCASKLLIMDFGGALQGLQHRR
jgi:hypothetical protein